MVPIHENANKQYGIEKLNLDDVDPLDGEQESSDEEVYDEDSRRHVTLSIRSTGKPFELKLKYVPANVDDPKSFILPLKLKGYNHEIEGLKRRIKAVGQKPRFFLDPTVVNFKTKVIAKGQKPLPFHQDITISNPDHSPVSWRIDRAVLDASSVFQMSPTEGVLEPGMNATVRVTFNPTDPKEYVTRIPLYLDEEQEKPYLEIEFSGEGADAKIYFDRRKLSYHLFLLIRRRSHRSWSFTTATKT